MEPPSQKGATQDFWFVMGENDSVAVHQPPEILETSGKLAIFDLDGTLARNTRRADRPRADSPERDIVLLPGRKKILQQLLKEGYDLVIVSNQKSTTKTQKQKLARMRYFYSLMGLPITLFASLQDDQYRKPKAGIWDLILEIFDKPSEAFYVGDAIGQPETYSDADIGFARNVKRKKNFNLKFIPAQDYFAKPLPDLPEGQKLILIVGAPGAGKTTLAAQIEKEEENSIVLSSDEVKTRLPTLTKKALREGQTVIIDATNGPRKKREIFYQMVKEIDEEMPIYVFWVVRDGIHANKMREHPVPEVAINTYFKYLEDPTEDSEPTQVYQYDYWLQK